MGNNGYFDVKLSYDTVNEAQADLEGLATLAQTHGAEFVSRSARLAILHYKYPNEEKANKFYQASRKIDPQGEPKFHFHSGEIVPCRAPPEHFRISPRRIFRRVPSIT